MNDTIANTMDIWDNTTAASVLSEFPGWFQQLNVGVRVFEGCLCLVANSLTILVVFKYEFLRTNTNILICNLAAADLIGGSSMLFLLAHFSLQTNVQHWLILCTIEMTLNLLSSSLNILSILLVALDRFIYINFPLRYYTLVKTWHVWAAIAFTWLWNMFQVAVVTSPGVQASKDLVCRSASLYVNQAVLGNLTNAYIGSCTVIIFLLYGRIAFVARKHACSIVAQMGEANVAVGVMSKAQTKITKMMALVLGMYVCCYIPQLIVLFVLRGLNDPPQWIAMTERAMAWVWWINSWMNPFVYAWKSHQFNRGFKLLLGLKAVPPSP